jgi:hypothetical protein
MTKASSEIYRAKAVACERNIRTATTYEVKCEWQDIAIEWHALASRVAQENDNDALEAA